VSTAVDRGERGVALLIVLLTITLLTVVVVEFTQSAEVETHFAISARNGLQAFYLARSAVNVGEMVLQLDGQNKGGGDNIWARPIPPLPIGDGVAGLRIEDETRRFNLNGLFSGGKVMPDRLAVMRRLFQELQADPRVLSQIVDWIDQDNDPWPDPPGAEQPAYLGLTPPVIVRNAPALTMRELLQVRDMTPQLFARLQQFVTVLPSNDFKVNLNTAPPEVLMAVSPKMTRAVVDRLIAARQQAFFQSPDPSAIDKEASGWSEAIGGTEGSGGSDYVTTSSDYFRIEAMGQINDVTRGLVTVVHREGRRIRRVTWAPSTADLSLTSQSPSDFLQSLPSFGGQS
jgi:general secretion pathway protein K